MAAAALGSDVVDEVDQPIIDARCVADEDHYGTTSRYCLVCCEVCSKICEKFGKHGLVKPKQTMRSLLTPLRMNKGMDEKVAPKKQADVFERPLLSSCDKAKIERKKRKDERQRAQYQMHVAEMEALRAEMPPVFVNHNNSGGPVVISLQCYRWRS